MSMTGTVVELRRCRCGKPARRRELAFQDSVFAAADVCDSCVARIDADLARMRPVFNAMIIAGVDRTLANETMTYMLDRMRATA